MPFDPTKPVDLTEITAAELRNQFNALKALIDAQPALAYGRVSADWTSTSTTFSDVTGLSWAIGANENWTADVSIYGIGFSGSGIKLRVTGPAFPASVLITMLGNTSSATAFGNEFQNAFSAAPTIAWVNGVGVNGVIRMRIVVINGTNAGTVQLQGNNSAGNGTVTIKANSDLVARRTG